MNKVIYTAIFGNYEDLKEPSFITPGWDYICFTDQPLQSSVWKIIPTVVDEGLTAQRMARKIKILPHIFVPSYEFSLWLDASFKINVDLNNLWARFFRSPFSCPAHPIRQCWTQEVNSCLVNKRGDAAEITKQGNDYKGFDVPKLKGIITSGVLFREQTASCIKLCNEWWQEVSNYSARDQIAFARIKHNFEINKDYHHFGWDYSQSKELKYIKHFHLRH